MAAATVVHFGSCDLYRASVLRNAGCEVRESDSLDRFLIELERDESIDVVMMSEVEPRFAERAAVLARERSTAPLILFSRPGATVDENKFDRVFSCSHPETFWLFETAVLVQRSQELRESLTRLRSDSEAIEAETRAVRAETCRQQARARFERLRNKDAGGLWKLEQDD
jgi:hypothetical protein